MEGGRFPVRDEYRRGRRLPVSVIVRRPPAHHEPSDSHSDPLTGRIPHSKSSSGATTQVTARAGGERARSNASAAWIRLGVIDAGDHG
jgi:hypothetical protein